VRIFGVSSPTFNSLEQALHFHVATLQHAQSDLVVFPELSLCPSNLDSIEAIQHAALALSHPTIHALRSICKAQSIAACIGLLLRESSKIYNAALTILPDESVHVYRKVHLVGAFPDCVVSAGKAFPVVQTPWGRVGSLICYDLDFPEAFRALALQGCDLAVLLSAWPREGNLWRPLLQVRALENHFYVVAVNHSGQYYPDPSMATDPFGKVLAVADSAGRLRFECNPMEKRGQIVERNGYLRADFLKDRVPQAYGCIVKS
jgi:predicted amidohydrolase